MARISSFQIAYKNQSFPALVSLANNDQQVVCTVHFIERKNGYLEPGDKLVYCMEKGLQQPQDIPKELCDELNRCIRDWVHGASSFKA